MVYLPVAALLLAGSLIPQQPARPPAFTKDGELAFMSTRGAVKGTIDIEIAETEAKRALGLMYREELGDRQGMLFIFSDDAVRSFWMKNTPVSLDIMFVTASREILTIHRNTVPFSEESYTSSGKVRYVVEVVAGYADRHRLAIGDKVFWQRM